MMDRSLLRTTGYDRAFRENNFMANAFQGSTNILHICIKSVLVETANSMTIMGR